MIRRGVFFSFFCYKLLLLLFGRFQRVLHTTGMTFNKKCELHCDVELRNSVLIIVLLFSCDKALIRVSQK